MGLLSEKVAVITGSSRGLGLEIARAYAREGAAVVLSSRTGSAVDQAVSELHQAGLEAAGMSCDASQLANIEKLKQFALDTYGHLDIWVNNAGISGPYGPTANIDPARFEQVLHTNIFGVYYGSLVAMRHFLAQHSGKLINILGRGDDRPVPFQNAYASTKAWSRWFTLALAKESKESGVGVYAFNPGLMQTDMMSDVEALEGYGEKVRPLETVMRMWSQPAEVPARKAVWLASSATDGKTGLWVNTLTPGLLIGGALKEAWRRIFRHYGGELPLNIHEIPLQ